MVAIKRAHFHSFISKAICTFPYIKFDNSPMKSWMKVRGPGCNFLFPQLRFIEFYILERLPIAQNVPLSLMNKRNLRQWQIDWLTYPIMGLISFEIYSNNVIKYNVLYPFRLNFVRQYELYSGCLKN